MTTSATGQVIVARNEEAFFRRAVDLVVMALRKGDRPSVALSGGSTPRRLFEMLARDARAMVPWQRVSVFWGDERCVPPDHTDSNYKMAWDSLLSKVPVLPENIHRMKGELEPEAAAREYEEVMSRVLSDRPFPCLDLDLLGMGEDGHTASLFPGSPGLAEQTRWVVGHWVEKLKGHRITMTFPVLNRARRTVVMVAGASKAKVLSGVFSGAGCYPIERINPESGDLIWLLDGAAAEKLPDAVRGGAIYV